MMKQYNRVCARIDLDAIEYNMEMMHKNTREGVSMISVIKTDGYGHGAVQIARMLEPKDYIWGYAVATLDEAVVLRKRGIKKPSWSLAVSSRISGRRPSPMRYGSPSTPKRWRKGSASWQGNLAKTLMCISSWTRECPGLAF